VLVIAVSGRVRAEDWPQFRGPTGQGLAQVESLPLKWDPARNARWKVSVPGKGWSSPIVHDDRIYLTTAVPSDEDPPKRQSLRALSFDATTGELAWNVEVFVKHVGVGGTPHAKNSYASPSPLTDGQHVFVHFGPDGTACLDRDGTRIWTNDRLRYNPQHGAGGSPVLFQSRLIFLCDGAEDPFVVALDGDSGAVTWRTPRPPTASPTWSFATPLLIEVEGQRQVVCPAAHVVCSYDPHSGKELWRVRYPRKWSIVPRPVFAHGLVFVCTGYDGPAELLAIRPTGSGDVTESHVAWRTDRYVPHIPSPLIVGDEIYLISNNGIASCRDVASGRLHWRERLSGSYAASPMHAGGRIYLQSEQGVCTVIAASRAFRELGSTDLGEPILASCAVADGAVFVRTESLLYRFE
jgi:outer membrane protein assembly factor BamB